MGGKTVETPKPKKEGALKKRMKRIDKKSGY
jgi:hypothetical protein